MIGTGKSRHCQTQLERGCFLHHREHTILLSRKGVTTPLSHVASYESWQGKPLPTCPAYVLHNTVALSLFALCKNFFGLQITLTREATLSLRAGSCLSHVRKRRAKRSAGKESGEEALPLDFTLAPTPRALVLQRKPTRGYFANYHPYCKCRNINHWPSLRRAIHDEFIFFL